MNKNNKQTDIQQLYLQFQQQRDSLPVSVLRMIMLAAKNKLAPLSQRSSIAEPMTESATEYAKHTEKQISTILQAAKQTSQRSRQANNTAPLSETLTNTASNNGLANVLRDIAAKFNRFTQDLLSPQFGGTPVMALCLVAVIGFALFSKTQLGSVKNHSMLDITYLEDCSICGQVAANSTIKLRSIDINIGANIATDHNKTAQVSGRAVNSNSGAGKFGRYALGLQLLDAALTSTPEQTHQDDDSNAPSSATQYDAAIQNRTALLSAIKRHARKNSNAQIIEYFAQLDNKQSLSTHIHRDTVTVLNNVFSHDSDKDLYYAGQWLERLRVTYAGAFSPGITPPNQGVITSTQAPSNQHITQAFGQFDEFATAVRQGVSNAAGDIVLIEPHLEQLAALKHIANTQTQAKASAEQTQQADFAIKKLLYILDM